MKKAVILLGIAAMAAITVCSCVKEIDINEPEKQENITEGIPYTIKLSTETLTKTEKRDGSYEIKWVANDEISVCHAEAGTNNFVFDGTFTTSQGGLECEFTGTLAEALDPGKSYDWYAVYQGEFKKDNDPESLEIDIICPGNALYAYTNTNGFAKGRSYYNTIPLCGKILNIPGNVTPGIRMNQLVSILKLTIDNQSSSAVPVARVRFDTYCDLNKALGVKGRFTLDIMGDEVKYKNKNIETFSDLCTNRADINNQIAPGNSETFYIPFVPFTCAIGDALSVSACGADLNYTYMKGFTYPEQKTFKAGVIYPVKWEVTDSSEYISDKEASDPVFFPFCKEGSNSCNGTLWQSKWLDDNNKFVSNLDTYSQTTINGQAPVKAWISVNAGGTRNYQSASGRFWLCCANSKGAETATWDINAKYAKLPAGKKVAFYSSIFLGKSTNTNPGTVSISYSYDGVTFYNPETVITSVGSYSDGTLTLDRSDKQYATYPVKVVCPAPVADIDNAQVIIRFFYDGIDGTTITGGQMGFAPYYEYSAAEGCRVYDKKVDDVNISKELIANDVANDRRSISTFMKELYHRSAYLVLE